MSGVGTGGVAGFEAEGVATHEASVLVSKEIGKINGTTHSYYLIT